MQDLTNKWKKNTRALELKFHNLLSEPINN
jgi:hypothetical protein